MDALGLNFKRELGQRRGVYLLSTSQYANLGIYKVGMAERSFNERFSRFKYAGYGAVDRILCFGLICIIHDGPMVNNAIKSTADHGVAQVCRRIEQDALQRLDRFRLRYSDTGRKSEWIRADLALALGVLGEYHNNRIYTSGPTRWVTVQCFGVHLSVEDNEYAKRRRIVE